eukprot:CAMPEP_0116126360 /NCGR_PEP_ID=MMETSP0329-20121206/6293_1 /TAXON_ID=697910 /ORGANISM="Pseudo-nitzschia arenysensis, Strain B593" /LENGTH=133 /DNA_ID=CAMNT_0003620443 /DNA_START=169 /DNA_END=570 /DNA_ORIENTATION=+
MVHWCYLEFEISSLKKKKDGVNDDGEDSIGDQIVGDGVAIDTKRGSDNEGLLFPWEPNYKPTGSRIDTREQAQSVNPEKEKNATSFPSMAFNISHAGHKRRMTEQSQTEELDFLASMTFANGGLRSPSCPCCV